MKKRLLILTISSLAFIFNSCDKENVTEENVNLQIEKTTDNILLTTKNMSCGTYTVGINIGIFYAETTICVCCGDPYSGPPLGSLPCGIENASMCDLENISKNNVNKGGLDLTDLLSEHNITSIDYIEVISSSGTVSHEGKIVKIKLGKYKVDSKNIVYLDYETL
jgi:hypothetical protein